jgi:hypothetical protein
MYLTVACPDCGEPMRLHAIKHRDDAQNTIEARMLFDRHQLTVDLAAHLRSSPAPHPTFHGEGEPPAPG